MRETISYHTRLDSDNTVRVTGGTFTGGVDRVTVERLVMTFFTVVVQPSGRPVFVDRDGRRVSLYFAIDPATTEMGKLALAEDRRARAAAQLIEDGQTRELQALLDTMTTDEALRRLKGAP